MSTKLNSTPTMTAMALAALLAAGCASQSTSDTASADNAAAGQSDVVSQTNPLDQPAEGTTNVTLPSAQTAQTMPYSDTTTASTASSTAQPMDSTMSGTTTDTTTTTTTTTDGTGYTAAQSLPPRADRN